MKRRGPLASTVAGVLITTTLTSVPVASGQAKVALPAAASSYTFTDLGTKILPTVVNDNGVVAGALIAQSAGVTAPAIGHLHPADAGAVAIWKNGKISSPPVDSGGARAILADGTVLGATYADTTNSVSWSPPYTSTRMLVDGANMATADPVSGAFAAVFYPSGKPTYEVVYSKTGTRLRRLADGAFAAGIGAGKVAVSGSTGSYLETVASGHKTALDFTVTGISADGATVGSTQSSAVLRLPNGTEHTIALSSPRLVDTRHDVLSSSQVLFAGTRSPVDVSSLVPARFASASVMGVSPDGSSIVGYATVGGATHGFLLGRPSVSVSVHPSVPKAGMSLGGTLEVPVTVKATGSTVTGARVTFTVPSARFDIVRKPARSTGLTVKAGRSVTLVWHIRAKSAGAGKVVATVRGMSRGATVTDTDDADITVVSKELIIVANTAPDEIHLPVDEDGKVGSKTAKVSIAVKNVSKHKLTDVVLQEAWVRAVDKHQQLNKVPFEKPHFPIKIGTMAAGSKSTKYFTIKLTGDGMYQIDSLATYGKDGKNTRVTATGGRFTVVVPPLYFRSKMTGNAPRHNGTPVTKGGDSFAVTGSVENLSSYKTLCLWPLYPKFAGNAGGSGPADLRNYKINGIAPPASGPIKPGGSIPIGMTLRTREGGATRAGVTFDPKASVLDDDETCDAVETPKTADPLTGKDKTFGKDALHHTGVVDVSVPERYPDSYADTIWDFGAGFTLGSIKTIGDTLVDSAIAAREAVSGYTTNPKLLLPTLDTVYATGSLLANYWSLLSVDEKQDLYTRVTGVLALAADDAWQSVYKTGSASIAKYMDGVEKAYEHGSDAEMARAIGEYSGSAVSKTVIDLALAEIGVGLAKKVPALARTFAKVGGESVTFATMKEIPVGKLVNFAEARRIWGAALEDWKAFRRIADEEGVLIGVRSRNPVSVANLEDGAVWKHENLKPKNVSDIDYKYLGFKKKDFGLVAMRSYTKDEAAAIEARIAKLSGAEREEVLDRWKTRHSEVPDYLTKIEQMSQEGKIDVGFNYSENGIGAPTTESELNFHLSSEKLPEGSEYYTPWQEKPSLDGVANPPKWCKDFGGTLGVLCRVTGDMDGVYITDLEGHPLPIPKLMAVYKKLQAVGWQHPETFTWVKQMTGEFWFAKKEKILGDLVRGKQKVLEFAPNNKVRAVWLDLEKSKSVSTSGAEYTVARIGGAQYLRK